MDTTITTIEHDAEALVSDVDRAVDAAEAWCEKLLGGGVETRVLGGLATELLNAVRALKADVDAIAQRLDAQPTTPTAPAAPQS